MEGLLQAGSSYFYYKGEERDPGSSFRPPGCIGARVSRVVILR
ncbi:hypothetical protein V6Z11_A04G023400 [Gossypium hirsutum]